MMKLLEIICLLFLVSLCDFAHKLTLLQVHCMWRESGVVFAYLVSCIYCFDTCIMFCLNRAVVFYEPLCALFANIFFSPFTLLFLLWSSLYFLMWLIIFNYEPLQSRNEKCYISIFFIKRLTLSSPSPAKNLSSFPSLLTNCSLLFSNWLRFGH